MRGRHLHVEVKTILKPINETKAARDKIAVCTKSGSFEEYNESI